MEQENEMTGQESLELISRMIHKARRDYLDSGLSALLWGSVIMFCSLATFVNYFLKWGVLDWVWWLTTIATIPQMIIAWKEAQTRKHRSYAEDHMGGIWISFAIAVFLLSFVLYQTNVLKQVPIFLILYGVPTFATGYVRGFRPMQIGGLACWVQAIRAPAVMNNIE